MSLPLCSCVTCLSSHLFLILIFFLYIFNPIPSLSSCCMCCSLVFVVPALVAPGSILHLTLSFLGVWFLFCIYFNYLFAVFTPAGSPPLPAQDQDQPEQGETERVTAGYRTCKKCSAEKPPRCHHCSQCGSCTLKFDHHCVRTIDSACYLSVFPST